MTTLAQRKFVTVAQLLGAIAMYSTNPHADNPFVQTNYTADPAPIVSGTGTGTGTGGTGGGGTSATPIPTFEKRTVDRSSVLVLSTSLTRHP